MSKNIYKAWNKSESTSIRGDSPDIAANRIFDDFYEPKNIGIMGLEKFSKADGIFTMGSCFARELEAAFSSDGFNILSVDTDAMQSPDFKDDTGKPRSGFFHRYNLGAMCQEFQRAFNEIDFKENSSLLIEARPNEYVDLNYTDQPVRLDLEGTVRRRATSKQMVEKVAHAKVIILTLGLSEAWYYKPDNLYTNAVPADVLVKHKSDLECRHIGYEENYNYLNTIYDILKKHHVDGNFHLFVTVSPVPLRHTFGQDDIVIANMAAKSTLRTVANEFIKDKPNVHYFPSYEIVMYSNRDLVWRPDRIHINKECVRFIMKTFKENYFDQ